MTVTSVHVLSYDDARAELPRPAGASYWHAGMTTDLDAAGLPAPDLRAWTVLACWPDRAAWEAALDGPGPWRDAAEAWSALLAAGPTRDLPAPARWADGGSSAPFGPAVPVPSQGPVAVVTTVGLDPADLGAVLAFLRDVQDVVRSLQDAPGSLGYRLAGSRDFPAPHDAFTFSLWSSARAAADWAYGAGVHARAMDAHTDRPHVLRGTFTTFSVLETRGSWTVRHALAAAV